VVLLCSQGGSVHMNVTRKQKQNGVRQELQLRPKMYLIKGVSSLNLRGARGKQNKKVDELIKFRCSFCKKSLSLGKKSFALVRLNYQLFDVHDEVLFCDKCADAFADIVRYGPRVLQDIRSWQRKSRVVRMSAIRGKMYCFSCLGGETSHVSVRFDNLGVASKSDVYYTKRVCARCAISYMQMMLNTKSLRTAKLCVYEAKAIYVTREGEEYEFKDNIE
jgi:hypothetical protein